MTRPVMGQRMSAVRVYLDRHRDRTVTAIELAEHVQLWGNHETKRRAMRRIVAKLHDDGLRICADCHPTDGGYWLARDAGEWRRYQESLASKARFQFVKNRRMKEAVTDRLSGQRQLFPVEVEG